MPKMTEIPLPTSALANGQDRKAPFITRSSLIARWHALKVKSTLREAMALWANCPHVDNDSLRKLQVQSVDRRIGHGTWQPFGSSYFSCSREMLGKAATVAAFLAFESAYALQYDLQEQNLRAFDDQHI